MANTELYALVGFFALVWLSSKVGYAIQVTYLESKQDDIESIELPMGSSLGAWVGGGIVTLISIYLFLF